MGADIQQEIFQVLIICYAKWMQRSTQKIRNNLSRLGELCDHMEVLKINY